MRWLALLPVPAAMLLSGMLAVVFQFGTVQAFIVDVVIGVSAGWLATDLWRNPNLRHRSLDN